MRRFCASKTSLSHTHMLPHPNIHTPSSFPADNSKAAHLLQFFFLCASVISYVAFVLSLFVPHLSFLCWAVLHECCISWVSSHFFSRLIAQK